MIARDGEGSTKFVEIRVSSARDWEQARHVGRTLANYDLLKTAIFGQDLNWGRIAAAIGAADATLDPTNITITAAGITPWDQGSVTEFDQAEARAAMQADEIAIEVDLGIGDAQATVWTCDLTYGYIEENVGDV